MIPGGISGGKTMVEEGNKVKVSYVGSLEDGTVFDSSEKHGRHLEFTVGSGQVIKGFDEAVKSLNSGEEKEIVLKPSEAYGDVNPSLLKKVPREQLPKDQEPKAGMMLAVNLPNGQQFPAKITAVDDKEVTIDLNNPLAGKVLKFKIKIEEIVE